MALYSALSLYLMWKVGPDRYVKAVQADKEEIVEGGDVSW
jgi:hypothetical protein